MKEQDESPPRLMESLGIAGDCVRRALAEPEPSRPLPRFAALQELRARRGQRQVLLGLVALASAMLLGVRWLPKAEPTPSLRAEPLPLLAERHEPPVVALPIESASAAPEQKQQSTPKPSLRKPRAPVVPHQPPPPATAATGPSMPAMGGARACAELARGGEPERAMTCYEGLAEGRGVSAELALFEQARLAGRVLRKPDRALALLDQHRTRFPNGSLRAEVMLARIDWLLSSGDRTSARAAVDEALGSGVLSERAGELERLRTTLAAP
jgi:hypothetical protein